MTSPQSATPLKPTDPFKPAAGARILAFGDYQPGNGTLLPLAEHWDGTSWIIVATPNP